MNFQNNTGVTRTGINGVLSLPLGFTSGTVTQNTSPFPDVANTLTTTNTVPYRLSIPPGVECGTRLPFTLNLTTNEGNLSTTFTLFVGTIGAAENVCQISNTIAINDKSDPTLSPVTVTGVTGAVSKIRAKVFIDHPEISQLDVLLQHPDGTQIILATRPGGPGALGQNMGLDSPCTDNNDTIYDDNAALSITQGSAPYTGTWRPEQQLSLLAGKPANGIWNLICIDRVSGKAGQIRCWCLEVNGFTCTSGIGECGVDLSVVKSDFPDPVAIDCPLTYTITVANNGTDTATSVTIQDILPPAVDFVSASSGCTPIGGDVYCDLGSLAVGTTKTVTVTVIPRAIGTLTNFTAVVSDGNETNPEDNFTSITTTVAPDCNDNCVPDAQDIANGTSLDCNANGVPDECDIRDGTSQDCNLNGIPDECETDCNSNGVPDDCDITSGTSQDTNLNGIPDECEEPVDLFVTKTAVPDPVAVDCPVTYTIVATNAGPAGASAVTVYDVYPLDFNILTTVPPPTGSFPGQTWWTFAGLAANQSTTITVVGTWPTTGTKVNDAVVSTTINVDSDLANNDAATTITVEPDCNANCIPDSQEPDCNSNGIPDSCDITSGTSIDCNRNGVPDECELTSNTDCNENGILDECEVSTATDCNANGILDECELTSVTDCDGNQVLDECELTSETDCNGNGILDRCEIATTPTLDCNQNGIPDDCELTTETDCDQNGILDECELTSATDCNENGVLDVCELTTETDCNDNGILDECEINAANDCDQNGVLDECELTSETDCNGNQILDRCEVATTPSLDCNLNGIPDECELTTQTDCDGNGVLDECELSTGTDCDGNGILDVCELTSDTDCNGNQILDRCEIATTPSLDCNLNGIPDECELTTETDCDQNGILDECELTSATDCNENGVLDVCELTTETDCNDNGILDECEINAANDCDQNGVLDECELTSETDCNGNQILDRCEIATSPTLDCNQNGILDECELTTQTDCDQNGVLDECEISTETDCNGNGVLDVCELTTETDCNANGVLDVCELSPRTDCNNNGILDECELTSETDCNGNRILDECELNPPCPPAPQNAVGTVDIPPVGMPYQAESPLQIIDGLPPGTTIEIDGSLISNLTLQSPAVSSLGGQVTTFDGGLFMTMSGTGALAGFNRNIVIPLPIDDPILGPNRVDSAPRVNFDPVQSFDTEMISLDGRVVGDPDFTQLQITAGTGFGLPPCPGHTTLTSLGGGTFAVDSFFDITYRIEFIGAPGGALEGLSGTTTGTVRVRTCPPTKKDCNANGILDECELTSETDCNENGILDECEITSDTDCNANGVLDICELTTDTDCDGNQILDECELTSETDCNGNGILDRCEIATTPTLDCNANGIPDECELTSETDCNANGVLDECELTSVTDCDGNQILDECELTSETDCNGNQILDRCEIATSPTLDCNQNGVLDECELTSETDCNGNGILDICELAGSLVPVEAADDCGGAPAAGPGVVYTGSNVGANTDGDASCSLGGPGTSSADVWYKYTPVFGGVATISLCASGFDTVLSVHTGCPGDTGNEVALQRRLLLRPPVPG